jgi:ubiquinone biosynthesis protein Coq4
MADGFKDRVFEFWFADDPLIQPLQREGQARFPDYFYIATPLQDTHGIWHITHDIVLERA